MSSSSVAKDLGATNTSVAREILRFAQNDSRWRGKCFVSEVLTYGQSEVCYASEVFAKAKVKFRLWRSGMNVGRGFTPAEHHKTLHSRISSVSDGFHHGVISSTFGGFHFTTLPEAPYLLAQSCQKATAPAEATLRESTPCDMGIFTV